MNLEAAYRLLPVPHGSGMGVIGRMYAEKRSDWAARWARANTPEEKAECGQKLAELDEAFKVLSVAAMQPPGPATSAPPPMPNAPAVPAPSVLGRAFPWTAAVAFAGLAATFVVGLLFWTWMRQTDHGHALEAVKADAARRVAEADAARRVAQAEAAKRKAEAEATKLKNDAARASKEGTAPAQTAATPARASQPSKPPQAKAPAPAPTAPAGPSRARDFKNSIGMEMVWVAPLDLWVGKYEVTQAEYQAIVGSNPSHFEGARRPVEQVSWNDAVAFVNKLNQREKPNLPKGFAYRLPFDAEYDVYVGNASLDDAVTSLRESRFGKGHEGVGSRGANQFGLYDTRGNVWEWMNDGYTESILRKDSDPSKHRDAIGGEYKVLRGGSWYCYVSETLAVACRGVNVPDYRNINKGFRVVLGSVSR